MTKALRWGGLIFCLPQVLSAHDPITTKITWTQEISRIVYKRCASCHREGGSAFSLMTYNDARPWAKAIRDEVLQRRMPPWGAVAGIAGLRDDPSLTQAEIDMIVNWVEGGAPKGDDVYLPRLPSFAPARPDSRPRGIEIRSDYAVRTNMVVKGIRPVNLDSGKSLEVTAYLPYGEVRHMIWLRDYRKEWVRTYLFREPVKLPKGTQIRLISDGHASIMLIPH